MGAVRVGVIDSGLPPAGAAVAASRTFCGAESDAPAARDALAHGGIVVDTIAAACPEARMLVAQMFADRGTGEIEQLLRAIDWLLEGEAELIHMSLGTRRPDAALRRACERARRNGVVLVASAPARGAAVYPAAYPECITATGDARCAVDELSWLGGRPADFGAHPRVGSAGGASFAAARVSGRLARLLADGVAPPDLVCSLAASCRWQGTERRAAR